MPNQVPMMFAQQGVTSLNPSDMMAVFQARSSRPLRMPVFVLVDYIKAELAKDKAAVMAAMQAECDELEALIATKAAINHTHTTSQITDFITASNALIQAKIDALINGAPAALDTLKEIADKLASEDTAINALVTGLAAKADTSTLANYVSTTSLSSTLAGYVTSSALTTALAPYATTAALTSGLAAKLTIPTGTTNQYLNGLGTPQSRAFSNPTRTLATAFQVSATRDADVFYSLLVTSNATLVLGSRGRLTLTYADNAAMTASPVVLPTDEFGVGSGLLVTIYGTMRVSGKIPAGKWVTITATNIQGTPTWGALSAQETLL